MTDTVQGSGLRIIFSIFQGLMLAVFVGVGAYTFYPPPEQYDAQIRDLSRREQAIRNSKPENELTTADRKQIQELVDQRNDLTDAKEAARKPWTRGTSVMLIVFATLAMAVSLVRTDRLPVISNGLLLGGVFTMLYGVGWIVATDTSVIRFLVVTIAFVITMGLGYVRFVRRSRTSPVVVDSVVAEGAPLATIERRLRDLEERMNKAADALARKEDCSSSS